MTLFLRKQSAQTKLEGGSGQWSDEHYAVVDDRVVGRIYKISGGPSGGKWYWSLPNIAFFKSPKTAITQGTAPSLDEAKEMVKSEYEKWLLRDGEPKNLTSVEVFKAYDEQREQFATGYAMIREAIETYGPPGILPPREQTGVTPIEEAEVIVAAIKKLAV